MGDSPDETAFFRWSLKNKLIKKVILITPNIPEAEILTKTKIKSVEDMIYAGRILLKFGAQNVLVKGGHLNAKNIQDVLSRCKKEGINKVLTCLLYTSPSPRD